ncbi:MAG: hypothetical protein H8K10_03550 [Nitrospira sp.]|nr:hypothetical protein [Nitrospira sp.]
MRPRATQPAQPGGALGPKLRHRATRQAFEFLRDLYTLRSWDDLTTHILNFIPTLIPTDICSYNDMSAGRRYAAYQGWPSGHPTIPNDQEILGRYTHQHPLIAHVERTKDFSARKITDFVSQREFRKTALYNEYYRPLQLPYNMGTAIALTQDSVIAIGLNRIKRDFADHDLAMLNLLRPHLVQAYGNAQAVSTMQEQLAAMQQAMEEMDRGFLSVSDDGRIRWASPRAHAMLASYALQGTRRTDWLPSLLREWHKQQLAQRHSTPDLPPPLTPLTIDHGTRSLRIRLVRDGEHSLLLLDELRTELPLTSLAQLGLSRRETEILSWVAQGKTNPEIGSILGISPRTVKKHLERIYSRLGVENRHAAMTVAMEAMQQGWHSRKR